METALGTLRKKWQHVSARWIADEVRQRICVRTHDQNNQISLATYGSGGDVTSRGALMSLGTATGNPEHDWRFHSSSDQC